MNNKLIKLTYINNPRFIDLTSEEKDRFENKFVIIHDRLPFIRNMSLDINDTINNGLINLIKENREDFINQIYMDFVENLIVDVSGIKFRDRKRSYKSAFIFNNEDDYYKTLLLFTSYVRDLIPQYSLRNLISLMDEKKYDFSLNKEFINLYMWYRPEEEYNKISDSFYTNVIKYLFIYFLSHNELINKYEFFSDITSNLLKDKCILDYYRMNYMNNEKEIPNDLINRYNKEKIIIK